MIPINDRLKKVSNKTSRDGIGKTIARSLGETNQDIFGWRLPIQKEAPVFLKHWDARITFWHKKIQKVLNLTKCF